MSGFRIIHANIINIKHNRGSKIAYIIIIVVFFAAAIRFFRPQILFRDPWSLVVEDNSGNLLGARIASDGQWRLPPAGDIPDRFTSAIVAFEDKRFFIHPGVDPLSLARAAVQNIRAGRVKSGGSTITMQVIRLSRRGRPRTLFEKAIEIVLALRLDLVKSKKEILSLYAAHAPFGGNVVGLEAASWRYFGRPPSSLSWAEAAALAVLPNEPGLVHPGKNRSRLLEKRNRLLEKLYNIGKIDSFTFSLSLKEPLPPAPLPLPDRSPHLCDRIVLSMMRKEKNAAGFRIRTTLNGQLQDRVTEIIDRHYRVASGNGIRNFAALVLEVERGAVLAYVGNTVCYDSGFAADGCRVDMITAPRSTGSVLKPLLYAAMLDAGELLPGTLIPDIPTNIGGYSPQNFNRAYTGAVHAANALARSLNVPAVRMLIMHGTGRFHRCLKNLGMTTLFRPPEEYGISLILGGAEGTLWDLTGIYAGMARCVNDFGSPENRRRNPFWEPFFVADMAARRCDSAAKHESPLSAQACWLALQAMEEVTRPGEESAWKDFSSSRRIAWKTGTSFGFRDAWAIGCTPRYAIGVWAGNATGEGRPGLIGIEIAGPVLFDILNILPETGGRFPKPEAGLYRIPVCRKSGYRAGVWCSETDTIEAPEKGLETGACPFHQLVHLDKSGSRRVSSLCADVSSMRHQAYFVLPPEIDVYYRRTHADYLPLPPLADGCGEEDDGAPVLGLIYPHSGVAVFVPRERDGSRGRVVLEAAHRDANAAIHWHLDEIYIGSTQSIHKMGVTPAPGIHTLTLVDNEGRRLERKLTVLDSNEKN